jgi:hypothetical protein
MSALFGAIGRNFWPVTGITGIASLVCAALGYDQAMAILACVFGGLLMWEAERQEAPSPAAAQLPDGVAEAAR